MCIQPDIHNKRHASLLPRIESMHITFKYNDLNNGE